MRRRSLSLLAAGLGLLVACRPTPSETSVKPPDSRTPVAFVGVRVFDGTAILEAGVDELAHGLWSNEAIPAPTVRAW